MKIPYGKHTISQSDINAVVDILRSDYITQGPASEMFERQVASYCDSRFAVATNSATSALHIACLSLGLGPGDYLWTSANTFVASANCALYCGAKVDFIDIDPLTYNISIEQLKQKLKNAENEGKLPKIVMPVHYGGQSCEMAAIYKLSQLYQFRVIEDASHALGGKYKNTKVGSCVYSDITVFSFHPVKMITTAEGGMAVTNCENLFNRLKLFQNHGVTRNECLMEKRSKEEIWNYQQIVLGFNYRMSDVHAALGLNQLKSLNKFVKRRNEIAEYYTDNLEYLNITCPKILQDILSTFHLYPIRVKKTGKNSVSQKWLYNVMQDENINVNVHYIPVHRHPWFEKLGFKKGDFPEAERLFKEVLTIPIFPTLSKQEINHVIRVLKRHLS